MNHVVVAAAVAAASASVVVVTATALFVGKQLLPYLLSDKNTLHRLGNFRSKHHKTKLP